MTAKIEMLREVFDIDGPSVRWGWRITEGQLVVGERLPDPDIAQHEWQCRSEAQDYADEIGVGTVSPEEMLAQLEADEASEMAAHARELERLQQTKLAVQRRTDGLTGREVAALRGRNRPG